MKQFFVIPIFIPEKACPFRCIYCNQSRISNQFTVPQPDKIKETIELYLQTFPKNGTKRIAFFGGNFTGISIEEQNQYLDIAAYYVKKGLVSSIQLSTRPDYINVEILENLKRYPVQIIELGAQSFDEEVLRFSGRGHTAKNIEKASQLIHSYRFELGLQMMIGLPYDNFEKTLYTAQKIIELKANYTRIYPTLVIKDTELENLFFSGKYTPLSLETAVSWSKTLMQMFEQHSVHVLRMGLHPSEGLVNKKDLVAGPFHISFKELVLSECWKDLLIHKTSETKEKAITITVNPKQLNAAIGYQAKNKKLLLEKFDNVKFIGDHSLGKWEFYVENQKSEK